MKYCQKCGNQLLDEAVVCPTCGCAQGKILSEDDKGGFGWGLLGFCIPVVGLILWLVWRDTAPLKAKSVGKGALVSVIAAIVLWIIYFVLILGTFASLAA